MHRWLSAGGGGGDLAGALPLCLAGEPSGDTGPAGLLLQHPQPHPQGPAQTGCDTRDIFREKVGHKLGTHQGETMLAPSHSCSSPKSPGLPPRGCEMAGRASTSPAGLGAGGPALERPLVGVCLLQEHVVAPDEGQ